MQRKQNIFSLLLNWIRTKWRWKKENFITIRPSKFKSILYEHNYRLSWNLLFLGCFVFLVDILAMYMLFSTWFYLYFFLLSLTTVPTWSNRMLHTKFFALFYWDLFLKSADRIEANSLENIFASKPNSCYSSSYML